MKEKTYKTCGKILLLFTTISCVIYLFCEFNNINSTPTSNSFLHTLVINFIIILGGLSLKNKYPNYYIYQVCSGLLILITSLICLII